MKRLVTIAVSLVLVGLAVFGQFALRSRRAESAPAMSEGVLAAMGGLRSIAAEAVWFRADRLQEEGRYVELAQLAGVLAYLEPHTPEVWSYAAWNLAYNISVMMPTPEDRWHWVHAGLKLLRDDGLRLNPRSRALCRELAWMFELKIGADIDSAAPHYREEWRRIVEDVQRRDAWHELSMDPRFMARIEQATGFSDWTNPQLSAIYWAARGNHPDIVEQAVRIYRRHRIKTASSPKGP